MQAVQIKMIQSRRVSIVGIIVNQFLFHLLFIKGTVRSAKSRVSGHFDAREKLRNWAKLDEKQVENDKCRVCWIRGHMLCSVLQCYNSNM